MPASQDRRADLIGWTTLILLGSALVGTMVYKVNHAKERELVGQSMMSAYMVEHQCERLARPVQNQPQLIRCAEGEMTEHLLRKKVVGDSWK